jgi:hypothetical protein
MDTKLSKASFDPKFMMKTMTTMINKGLNDRLKIRGLDKPDGGERVLQFTEVNGEKVYVGPEGKTYLARKPIDLPLTPQFICLFAD